MKTRILIIAFAAFLITLECYSYTTETVYIEMRDGVKLYTLIFKPDDTSDFPLPVIMIRANTSTYDTSIPITTDEQRYIYVKQAIRSNDLLDTLINGYDAYDTVEWLSAQDWCDGDIGTWGGSRFGAFSYGSSLKNPQHLKCVSVTTIFINWYDYVYPGGCFRKNDIEYFHQNELPSFKEHYSYSEWWDKYNMINYFDTVRTPIFHFGGWYDLFAPAQLDAFYHLQYHGGEGARGNQKVIIGPQQHTKILSNESGQITFPLNAIFDRNALRYKWFDYWMKDQKDNMIADYPNISLYLMGPVGETGHWNNWLTYDEWPFTDTDTLRFYPADNKILSLEKDASGSQSFDFDPNNPVPTVGGNNGFYTLGNQEGPYDQRNVWERPDVLVFETPYYDESYDIFGNIKLKVFMSSDRTDTDITAKLVDIYPDGRHMLINDGIIMARLRNGVDREELITPGEIYEMEIDLNYTAYTVVPGHKLGLAISSSNYPRYRVNPNTGEPLFKETEMLIATNTIYFGGDQATELILPIRKTGFTPTSVNDKISESNISIYPNPFSQSTTINYELREAGYVSLKLFDMLGNEVSVLVDEWQEAGRHQARFDGIGLPAGVYYYSLRSGERVESGKMILIR